ncbi:MAG TPA: AAA family ATPase, partial [Polyangiaceae bacterium]
MPEEAVSTESTRPGQELPKLTRFEVVRRIGEGGAGLVYEAIDRERNARVALKMLRALDGELLLRLKEEFRALQDLEHPNLIRLFELVSDAGVWFFTMELIDGETFVASVGAGPAPSDPTRSTRREAAARRIAEGAPVSDAPSGLRPSASRGPALDEVKLRASLAQLARGLGALHTAGKVHRDIKPSNVLVARDGRVVILDFGLVHDATAATAVDPDLVVGTISHMAPEQAAGADVGAAADWYSVGVVLYQCLTGRHPFEGPALEVLTRKQMEDPPPPRELAPSVPAELDALCMDLLARDPSKRPGQAEILRRLSAREGELDSARLRAPERAARAPGWSPFVGRAKESAALAEAFAQTRRGGAVTLVVEGESGVGKSALVRRFTKSLRDEEPDVLVLSGRCYEREDVPYKAIDGVIDALSHHLASLGRGAAQKVLPSTAFVLAYAFPVLRRVPGMELGHALRAGGLQESRSLLFHALRELFVNLAAERPVVMVIDDLQWADADSLAVLASILRVPSPPLFLLATARAGGAVRAGEAPFGLPGDVRVLPLSRLNKEEGLALVSMLSAEISPSVALRIAEESGGHPLFVDELVRHTEFLGGRAPAAVHLDDALVARASRLEDAPRGVLEVLAVAGVALRQELVARATGMDLADFAAHAQTLRAAHLARTHGWRGQDAIETYHDRVRESVTSHLTPEARKQVHARLATALEAEPEKDADALSTHWLGAGEEGRAGSYAREAGEQALRALAFESAARMFERALALGRFDGETEQALRIKLGETLANAGRGHEAAQAYFAAAATAGRADRALDLTRRAAEELLTAGRLDEGDAALRDVLVAVGIGLPRTPLSALLLLLWYRLILFFRGSSFVERKEASIALTTLTRLDACNGVGRVLALVDTIRGSYFQVRGLVDALRVGEPSRIAHAMMAESAYYAAGGNSARSKELSEKAAAIAARLGRVQQQALVETVKGFSQFMLGEFDQALADIDHGAAVLREQCPGAFWDRRTALLAGVWTVGWMGHLNALAERVEQGVREAEHRGDIYTGTSLRTGVPNLVWLRKGDPAAARAVALEAMRQWTQRGYHAQHYWSMLALARIELYEGDAGAAYARVSREWSRVARALILQVRVMGVEALHLRGSAALAAAASAGPRERAPMLAVAERSARRIAGMRWELGKPLAQVLRAGVAAVRGDEARAASDLA